MYFMLIEFDMRLESWTIMTKNLTHKVEVESIREKILTDNRTKDLLNAFDMREYY
jgi:hypothetical protein